MIDQTKIVKEAKDFVDLNIRPYAKEFEEKERIPRELINKMAEKGYLAANFPVEYGGLGLDAINYGRFTEVIGRGSSSVRALLTVHSSLVGETIIRWGSTSQKDKILPLMANGSLLTAFALTEPRTGTDAKSIKTNYKKIKDRFIINGSKKWITFAGISDLLLVIAENQGKVTAFLVDSKSKGVKIKPIKGLIADKAAYISEIEFNNVSVDGSRILGSEGTGFTYIVNTALDYGRFSVAWGGLAIAQEALEAMVSYSRNRTQFGKSICSFQLIQGMIGDATTKIHAARALCENTAYLIMNKDRDATIETTISKYYTSLIANEITSDAVQIHGGNGCYNKFPVERLFREAKILEIIEGTNQIQQAVISNYSLRKYYNKNYYVE